MAQKRSEGLGEELRSQLGDVHAHMVDSIQGMREISAFGQGPARTAEMVDNSWKFAHFQLRFLKERAFQIGFIEGMTALGGLAVLAMGVWLMTQGEISRPQLILSVILSVAAFAPISDIARTIKQLMETLAAARRLFVVHDEPVPVVDGPGVHGHENGQANQNDQNGRSPALSFDHVGFSYGHGEAQALHGVTFDVQAGQTVALVGRSGAGKTTCANLVMRFWDPGEGHVRLSGHDLRDFELEDLRRQIALVSQDTYLFNASIRDNLKLGKIEATEQEIEDAARQANAHEFIIAFPDGYDTMVGERGMQLSGGQRQRISIARALLKNAPVLILDEATSHLDAVNERQVRQALETLMEGRTTVVIAHRLSTTRDADRIVVLDNGHVEEQGNHHDLLASHGLYAQLVSTQLVSAATGGEHNGHREGHHDEHGGDDHDGHGDNRPGPLPDMPDVNPPHHH
jgi:ATP-binding cassette subfamily C protein CydCD